MDMLMTVSKAHTTSALRSARVIVGSLADTCATVSELVAALDSEIDDRLTEHEAEIVSGQEDTARREALIPPGCPFHRVPMRRVDVGPDEVVWECRHCRYSVLEVLA